MHDGNLGTSKLLLLLHFICKNSSIALDYCYISALLHYEVTQFIYLFNFYSAQSTSEYKQVIIHT